MKQQLSEIKRMQELAGIDDEQINDLLKESAGSNCLVVIDTSCRIWGVFTDEKLANEWKRVAERDLGFQGSDDRVNIKKTKLYR